MLRDCALCRESFLISDEDLAYYERASLTIGESTLSIPPPTHCPRCRAQRRLAWRNERNFYVTQSALTGNRQVSVLSPDKRIPVYSYDEWWSERYDPLAYGRPFDFNRPFFEQFADLLRSVPHMALIGSQNENSPYCHLLANCKNCYMVIESSNNEDCYFGYWLQKCLGCVDCSFVHECNYCYEADNCYGCYNLRWSRDCTNCSDSSFLESCTGCRSCFGCVNLHQREFCVFNEQLSPEAYRELLASAGLASRASVEKWRAKAAELSAKLPRKYAQIVNSENCSGDYIVSSRNCTACYHAHDAEHCKFGEHVWRDSKYNMDVSTAGRSAELIYECINTGISSYRCHFGVQLWSCADCEYCYSCFNSQNCFGSVGLKKNNHCIFNVQYDAEGYQKLAASIVEHMKRTGEYGEFFPARIAPFGYNETAAQDSYPLSREEAPIKGFNWSDFDPPLPDSQNAPVMSAAQVPDDSALVSDEILKRPIRCELSGRLFKLTSAELQYYRKHQLPLPVVHPNERHRLRLATRSTQELWQRQCSRCPEWFASPYPPSRREEVLCEACYRTEVFG